MLISTWSFYYGWLHSVEKPVCKKCIYEKILDEEMDCCPVCNIDLGCLPVEKLRIFFTSNDENSPLKAIDFGLSLCKASRHFWAQTESGIFQAVLKADPSFDEAPWPSLSPDAIDFVKRLLNTRIIVRY
nr:cdpk-related kinase 7 [Quercus suber]